MGAFIVNFHLRIQDRDRLVHAVRDLATDGCWVTAPKDGWATIYDERASTQDDARIRQLGTDLSSRLDTWAAAFLIHDSDFLCYWLFDRGEIVDEFNSCPDYFEDDGPGSGEAATVRGRPEVLLRFCKPGSQLRDVDKVLEAEAVFAEEQLQELAGLLGIDEQRALTDYRDLDETMAANFQATFIGDNRPRKPNAPGGWPATKLPGVGSSQDDAEEGENNDDAERPMRPGGSISDQIAKMMGLANAQQPHEPLKAELVQAAAEGKVVEMERLIAAGADVKGEAPMKMTPAGQSSLSARMMAGGGIAFPVTPLLAAIAHKRVDAARRLIELGADVHSRHRLFGSPLHGAVSAGSLELVRLLLDAGADVNERNTQGQTPIEALRGLRAMLGQLDSLRRLGGKMFEKIEPELNRLTSGAGWDECEALLRARGGR